MKMEGFLIEFDSPNQKKDDSLLPKSTTGSTGFLLPLGQSSGNNHGFIWAEDDNPFDLVVSQVAANTAAQDDPFEMVLNNALSSQGGKIKSTVMVSPEAIHISLGDPTSPTFHNTKTLDSIDHDSVVTNCQEIQKVEKDCDMNHHSKYESIPSLGNSKIEEWSCLDDIPPPDSFLSSSEDMSYLLDDTLSTSILSLSTAKDTALSDEFDVTDTGNNTSDLKSFHGNVQPVPSPKSEEDLKLLAQKKIENLISRAEFEVKHDMQDSALKKRLSTQTIAAPSTPRSIREVLWESEEQSRCLLKWSQEEVKKFNVLFDMTQSDSCPTSLALELESKICKDITTPESSNSSILGIHSEASSLLSTSKHLVSPRGKSFPLPSEAEGILDISECLMQGGSSANQTLPTHKSPQGNPCTEDAKLVGQAKKSLSLTSSPVLLPLPLCEDAVRNLSLCSKYSPGKDTHQHKSVARKEDPRIKSATYKQDDSSKHTKLVVRKPTEALKVQPKMAPMKATAPLQNMTRARTSLTTHFNNETSNSTGLIKKNVPKVSCSRMPLACNLRKPDSPTLSGSLPNLTSQVSKLPTRLPSPRRSSGNSQQKPATFRKQVETSYDRNSSATFGSSPYVYSSPRPLHKSASSGRSASVPRVLTDINTSPVPQKSIKRRNIQAEVSKRGSISTEKENFL